MQKKNPKRFPHKKAPVAGTQKHVHSDNPAGLKNVCVYCGSGSGSDPAYSNSAKILGRDLANAGIGLVYGGGGLGLMGEVARTTIKNGGRVTGIIPTFLSELEHMLKEVDELILTSDMHERKKLMFEKSDAFIALPGGIGTMEELVEQLTWSQLGQHKKPVVIANIKGYWTPFLDLITHMKEQKFIREELNVRLSIVDNANDILPCVIAAHEAASKDTTIEAAKIGKSKVIAKM